MPRTNNPPGQSRPNRPAPVRGSGAPPVARPQAGRSRGPGPRPQQQGRKPSSIVSETFTLPLGDVVVKKGTTTVATAASLLPSSSNLSPVYTQIRGYSLQRLLTAKVVYRPAATAQSGQVSLAFDPVTGTMAKTPADLRSYETTAGGLVGAPHTLAVPVSALSHVGWSSWVGPCPVTPGYSLLCASIPTAPASDLTLGALELSLTVQSKSRRPLPP